MSWYHLIRGFMIVTLEVTTANRGLGRILHRTRTRCAGCKEKFSKAFEPVTGTLRLVLLEAILNLLIPVDEGDATAGRGSQHTFEILQRFVRSDNPMVCKRSTALSYLDAVVLWARSTTSFPTTLPSKPSKRPRRSHQAQEPLSASLPYHD